MNLSNMRSQCKRLGINYEKMSATTVENLHRLVPKTLIVSAGNTYIIDEETLHQSDVTAINYHNALLPLHRGMNAEAWSIYEQEQKTGITWHVVEPKVDVGPIVFQEEIQTLPDETSLRLLIRQAKLAFHIFQNNIEDIVNSKITFHEQQGNSSFHKIKEIPNNGYVSKYWTFDKTVSGKRGAHTKNRKKVIK